ncbi:MAG: glycosyltransferase family 1 protein [Patescibacteria group bacterium]
MLRLAIDANEANTTQRVGSNVYAFQLLTALESLTQSLPIETTILLAQPPIAALPKARQGWQYQVIQPTKFWTQWALPLYLYRNREHFDVLFTPGHYAPRFSPIPYVSAVMDTAYLEYPQQFTMRDRIQLTKWTEYSVKKASHVITISQHAKQSIVRSYKLPEEAVSVVYPAAVPTSEELTEAERSQFFSTHTISEPFILYVGTLQPRKNLDVLISAFESFSKQLGRTKLHSPQGARYSAAPTLVLAGKIGWLADSILERIEQSPFANRIITPGFISDAEKKALYKRALCTTLIGLHEGFGIPPLEAMSYGCIPVVANATSLPEVVGEAGYIVEPSSTTDLSRTFLEIAQLNARHKAILTKKGREQAAQFSWHTSAAKLLKVMVQQAKKSNPTLDFSTESSALESSALQSV